jgi:23S rRNA U2552 (ribose-2'-O)-methylase RlmE/FtsJ
MFYENPGKDIFKWNHYFPIYERHFERFVNRPVTVLEIGCLHGGSLQLWKRYFGPHATIIGVDIEPACLSHVEDQINIRIGSQNDTEFLKSVVEEFGIIDIVIDDGSHISEDQIISFNTLFDHVSENGIYALEDLHTNYWEETGGGVQKAGTFIETAKHLIDELNAYHTRGALDVTRFTNTAASMHFYDSMVIIEKARLTARRDLIVANRDGNRVRRQVQYLPLKLL